MALSAYERSILNDSSVHDHDAATIIEPLNYRLPLLDRKAFPQIGGIVEQNAVRICRSCCSGRVANFGS